MPARKGSSSRASLSRPPDDASAGDGQRGGRGATAAQMDAFRRGLYPILLEGDLAAFRRCLAQWEDVIGDTAELTETPPEVQRRTMAALLLRPQQFNLPPWPKDLVSAPSPEHESSPTPPDEAQRGETGALAEAADERGDDRANSPAGRPEDQPADQPPTPARYYQADMLTGELVPVSPEARAHQAAKAPAPPEAQRERRPERQRSTASQGRGKSRIRRPATLLEQLALWPDPA